MLVLGLGLVLEFGLVFYVISVLVMVMIRIQDRLRFGIVPVGSTSNLQGNLFACIMALKIYCNKFFVSR